MKKLITHIPFLGILTLWFNISSAQIARNNIPMQEILKDGSTAEWLDFKKGIHIDPYNIFKEHRAVFNLGNDDEMKLVTIQNDEIGYKHFRYQQFYKGVRVEGGEFIVHVNKNGEVYCANGKMPTGLNQNILPSLTANRAIDLVMKNVNAKEYMWQSKDFEDDLKKRTNKPDTSYYPIPELVMYKTPKSQIWDNQNFSLAYRIDMYSVFPNIAERIYIDANTGEIINKIPLESNCSSASVNTVFNGAKTIYSDLYQTNTYRLKDDCQSATIRIRDWNSTSWGGASPLFPTEITNSTNTWSTQNERFGASVLWATKQAYNYFLNVHNRLSYNDKNGSIEGYINAVFFDSNSNAYTNNATMSFTGGTLKVGLGSTGTLSNSFCTLDILGHEYTHAVTGASAQLVYQNESGALNESFSDIFGEAIENYILGSNDWLIGADRSSGYVRSLSNPKSRKQPDTFQNTNGYWYNGTDDYGGVHCNSGVQNYWFYLLANGNENGGVQINDNGYTYAVNGQGIDKARRIAYRNLTYYLVSNSVYGDAKIGSISAAVDLFGGGSTEVTSVIRAWCAVGLGTSCINVPSNNLCSDPIVLTSNPNCNYTQGSTAGASRSIPPIACNGIITGDSDDDVWYKFIASSTAHTIRVQSGNAFDAVVDVRSGNCPGTNIACADATSNGGLETINLTGLSIGAPYLIRVYHAGSGSGGGSFEICVTNTSTCTTPTTQASNISFSAITTNQMILTWAKGNGNRRIIKINTTNNFTAPTNGTDPSANNNYSGSGEQVIYNGSGNSATVTGLLPSTNYCFRIYEANCSGNLSLYYTSTASNNPSCQNTIISSCATPTTQAANISFSAVTPNQMTVNWTNGNGSKRVVKINTVNNFNSPPNGTDLVANNIYSGSGEQVIYNGSGNSATVTGLLPSTNYCFRVYEVNCSGNLTLYNTSALTNNPACDFTISSSCLAPTTQASNINFSNTGANYMTVNWTNGNGSRRIVKVNTVNSFTPPADGTNPSANNNYSGSGEEVVYNGNGSSFTITGLSPGTNYCFMVYEANCSGFSSLYLTTTNTNNPACQNTSTSCTTPTIQASNVSFFGINPNQFTVNWSNGDGNKRIVKINTINNFSIPSNGTDPTANTTYSGSGEQVVYNGNGNSVTVTGLSPGTNYCLMVYEANCSGNLSLYCSSNGSNNPFCQTTTTSCNQPNTPVPNFGNLTCPGLALYGSGGSIFFNWTNVGNVYYDIEIREYPYDASNIIFTQSCISGWNINVNYSTFVPGKLYAWRVRATTDCNTCNSNYSPFYFFHFGPSVSPSGSIYVCNGVGTTLSTPAITVPSPGTVSYQWYQMIGGKYVPVGANSNTNFVSTTGNYNVKLIYSGSSICLGPDTTGNSLNNYVSIATTPAAPILTSNSPTCEGNTLTLSASSPSNSLYFWTGPNGFSSNNNNIYFPTVTVNSAGSYDCYVINSGCQSPTSTINISIVPAPIATFTYNIVGNAVTFTNTSTNATSCSWNFGDGQTSTQTNPLHTYSNNNNYICCLTANGSNCNSASNCQLIALGGGTSNSTLPTFAKLFNDTVSSHKSWITRDIIQSPVDSGYICVGWYQNTANNSNNCVQYYKLDKNGNILWARSLPEYSSANITKIVKSQNGYLLSLNYSQSTVMEIDEQGNKLWAKTFNSIFEKFIKINTGGYLGASSSCNNCNGFDLIKIDNSGNIVWQKQFSYSLYSNTTVAINNIVQDAAGNFYLYGFIGDGTVALWSWDGLIIKIDANGNNLWTYYNPIPDSYGSITSLVIDNNSDLILGSHSIDHSTNTFTGYVSKVNSSGAVIYSKQLSKNGITVFKAYSGNIGCVMYGSSGHPNIVTLNSSLSITNQKEFLLPSVYSVLPTFDNRFILGCGQYPLNTNNNDYRYNIFKVSYTDNSCLDTLNSTITLINSNFNLSSLSTTINTPSVTLSNFSVNPLVSTIVDSIICYIPVDITNIVQSATFHVYPNPTNGILNITASNIENGYYKFALKNIIGQTLYENKNKVENNSIQKQFSISELPDGIYFLNIESEKMRTVLKINKLNY